MQFCQKVLTYLTLLGGKQLLRQILTWNSSASNDCETMSFIAHLVLRRSGVFGPSFVFDLITRQIKVEIGKKLISRPGKKSKEKNERLHKADWIKKRRQIPMWCLSSLKRRTKHEDCNETWSKTHEMVIEIRPLFFSIVSIEAHERHNDQNLRNNWNTWEI